MDITTTIPSITGYAGTVPDKATQTKTEFANSINPYLNYVDNTFVPSYELAKTALNSFATEANALATQANTDASTASAAATTAQSTANASLWVSGQAYTAGQSAISPINFKTYRANTSTSGTTDPSLSADWTAIQAEDATKLPLAGGTMTGDITSLRETSVAMGANDINCATGNLFTKTISVATTLTVSNVPTTGEAYSFVLKLTNGGSAAVTWFSGVKWAGGTAPTLTASGVDAIGFITHDGGTTWYGFKMGLDLK